MSHHGICLECYIRCTCAILVLAMVVGRTRRFAEALARVRHRPRGW